ncbi:GMP synthase (glutamine-hydrolyzing), partial [Campylobacter jejuni]|nr:GMP synthase (glutamine-hydrolyzing) [Campylobacter jejuni]
NGLLRSGEKEQVDFMFKNTLGIDLISIDASEILLSRLANVTDHEQKRIIIGNTFIEVFEEEAKKHKDVKYLSQGTLYTDIIESSVVGASKT